MLCRCRVSALAFVLLALCGGQTSGRRSLNEIRYRFTTCGNGGRTGPSYSQCIDHYRNSLTSLREDTEELILEQTSPNFEGGQLFRIPRAGLYNVTVAGAAGGRGLCSPLFGRGRVVTAQAEFSEGHRMLILVGQKGRAPCDFEPDGSFCPNVTENATECNETWWNFLVNTDSPSQGRDIFAHRGGAGGGGASMIRLENEGGAQIFPFIVAGGGGGGASVLDLDFVNTVNFTHSENATLTELYQEYVDGKIEENDPVLSEHRTERGFVVNTDNRTAGAGGGYLNGNYESRRVDGSALIQEDAFAEGGRECVVTSLVPTYFTSEVGGFGAGGGGCGGGGGGGGHTGGAIVGISNTVPGGGGHSFVSGGSSGPRVIGYSLNNESDGYVDIVAADCGCVYECVVYEEEDQFECLCPNNTQLAPDLSDCYYTDVRELEVSQWAITSTSGLQFSLLDFGNATHIFSISAALAEGGSEDGKHQCVIAFIGTDEDIVLVSAPGRDGQMLSSLSLVTVNLTEGSLVMSNFTSFLSEAVEVTGGILVGMGKCRTQGSLSMNVSLHTTTPNFSIGYPTLETDILANPENTAAVFGKIFRSDHSTSATPASDTKLEREHIAAIVVSTAVITVLVTLIVVTVFIIGFKHHNRKGKAVFNSIQKVNVPANWSSSLVHNAAYFKHKGDKFPDTTYERYTDEDTSGIERYSSPRPATLLQTNNTLAEVEVEVQYEAPSPVESDLNSPSTVIPPAHDFFNFNRTRCDSMLKDTNWQYPRSQLIYMRELGEGQFGKVLLMKAKDIAGYKGQMPVAVKTLSSRDPELVAKFMEEADLMKRFSHPNIVSLLGISTDDIHDDDNAPLMILEYMPYGDLLAFLQKRRPSVQKPTSFLKEAHFISFATDVAKAMKFLARHNYVHRDIAARNCLVGAGLCIKIADFGLARKVSKAFKIQSGSVLPIRSMAPECFITGEFTTASDVWSYGVLLWEIVTFGAIPLQGMTTQDIVDEAHSGHLQHQIPPNCPIVLASLISQCHSHDSGGRPSFADILNQLRAREEDLENSK